jgi:hypothetical protein
VYNYSWSAQPPLSGDTLGYHDDVGPCMADTRLVCWSAGRDGV